MEAIVVYVLALLLGTLALVWILRRRCCSRSFVRLQSLLGHKGRDKSVSVVHVDPRYTTSRSGNREAQDIIECAEYGLSLEADLNAARNIGALLKSR